MTTAICCIGEPLLQIEHLLSARMRGGSMLYWTVRRALSTSLYAKCPRSFHLAAQRSRFLLHSSLADLCSRHRVCSHHKERYSDFAAGADSCRKSSRVRARACNADLRRDSTR